MKYIDDKIIPLELEELVEEIKCLQEGRDYEHVIGKVDLKIGDVKKCRDCGEITDLVSYDGLFDHDSNYSTECECSRIKRMGEKPWYEPCDDDDDDDCDFHKDLDVVKLRKEDEVYRKVDEINKIIFDRLPPVNDGILEFDRMVHMFKELFVNCNTPDAMLYVHTPFQLYCARNGLITK